MLATDVRTGQSFTPDVVTVRLTHQLTPGTVLYQHSGWSVLIKPSRLPEDALLQVIQTDTGLTRAEFISFILYLTK